MIDTFGEWLRGERNTRRLTREQFAQRVGCSVAALRKIEDDERRPSVQVAELMANALEVPAADRETFIRVARGEWGIERLGGAIDRGQHRSSASTSTSLPVSATPLIGRQRELEELHLLLRDPH